MFGVFPAVFQGGLPGLCNEIALLSGSITIALDALNSRKHGFIALQKRASHQETEAFSSALRASLIFHASINCLPQKRNLQLDGNNNLSQRRGLSND